MAKRSGIRFIGGITAALTLTLGTMAQAAEFGFKGSDTLYDVLTEAITKYKVELGLSDPATQDFVKYLGTGSGNGEKSLGTHAAANTPFQRIAGMSRNFTAAAQTTCTNRVGVDSGGVSLCAPELKNILGLDAAVIGLGAGAFTTCPNIQVGLDPAKPGFAPVDNDLALILSGKGGTGDWKACTAPERVQAIQRLLNCSNGLGAFSHYYRRDDSSGTTDSVREKLQIQRFCNGSAKPAAGMISANLFGSTDQDPIRTSCPAPVAGASKPVRCTVTDPTNTANYLKDCSSRRCSAAGSIGGISYAAGFVACEADADCTNVAGSGVNLGTCSAGLPASEPGCTAGFVIALSEPDNASVSDITMTIAQRVLNDSAALAYFGREGIKRAPVSGQPAKGATINTNQPSDSNVRQDKYMMARRLFLQDTCNQGGGTAIPTSATAPGDTTGVPGRDDAECTFFQWATDELPAVSAKAGRENLDPIMKKWGFISCDENFAQPTGDGNLCSKDYAGGFPFGADAPSACVANNRTTAGWVATAITAGICCSDGLAFNHASHGAGPTYACPVPAARSAGSACIYDADCASNSCDGFGTATVGTCN